jgi:SAM-dependent methyltransferase
VTAPDPHDETDRPPRTPAATGLSFERQRLSFGGWADDYERFRPGYPPELVAWLVGAPPPARVVDVGAGTGRLAVALADLGYDVVAVEPDEGMRAVAESVLPGRTAAGSAEELPVGDGSVDAVVAGQAYHWFDPERAHAEAARALRPGGCFGVVWNLRDDRSGWSAGLTDLTGSMASVRSDARALPPTLGEAFTAPERREVAHEQVLDLAGLLGLVASWSYVALRPDRDEVLDGVRELVASHPDTAGRERFALPYVCRGYRAHRR